MNTSLLIFSAMLGLIVFVSADVYMHMPRGSNNRLNEANTNRNNNNRLFDSQNNAKGGYCYGPAMSYYEGSQLSMEWTAQHGCGSDKQFCNIVVQYMCGSATDGLHMIRDGGSTNTLPDSEDGIQTENEDSADGSGFQFGMHETYYWNKWCRDRERNKGLYTADRNVADNQGSRASRQNNNGGRSGYECAEERDYYPYNHPTPWKDIAVLTDDTSLCGLFQKESQNVKAKGYCVDPDNEDPNEPYKDWATPNNAAACAKQSLTWKEYPAWGIAKPDCIKNHFTRDNHLGNTLSGYNTYYNWTLPTKSVESCIKDNNCKCVVRLRYNISTFDFSGYKEPFADSNNNQGAAFLTQDPDLPAVTETCGDGTDGEPCNVTLAINTAEFARTFQDRSYVFGIRPRPKGMATTQRIFNLNVKGKRGNIVQTYPSTEYDFHPNDLHIRVGDYIHFQWTGCDTNPAGNAGEGTDGTDRSNMIQIETLGHSVPASDKFVKKNPLFQDSALRRRFAFLDQTECTPPSELNNADQDEANCNNLNHADRYFDGGLIKMNKTGTFFYMSSRNNNFTNRGQKGTITVTNYLPNWAIAMVAVGGGLFLVSMGAGAAMIYAKSHPHSSIATFLGKL